MPRRQRPRVLAAALPLVLLAVAPQAAWTDASWRGDQYSRAAVGASGSGTVAPPRVATCLQSGLLVPPRVGWTAPVTGTPTGVYRWTLTVLSGVGAPGSGTLPATATSWSDPGGLLSVAGTWRLSVQATNAAGWSSSAITATVGQTSVAGVGLSSTCSVP